MSEVTVGRDEKVTAPVGDPEVKQRSVGHRISAAVFRRTGDSIPKLLGVAALLSVIGTAFVIVSILRVHGLSTLDEYAHLDWVYQVQQGNIPADGDLIAGKVLADWSCIGQWNVPTLPPCGVLADPSLYPHGGQQHAALHPPVYYALTAGLVTLGELFVGDQHFIDLARAAGALWLSAAMVMLYVACRTWRIRTIYAIAAPLLLMTLPRILTAATIVTNDAPAALAGAYALYFLGRLRVARTPPLIVPSLLALFFLATKVLNAIPMLLIAGGLGCWGIVALVKRQPITAWRRLRGAFVLTVPSAVFYLLWQQFQHSRAEPGWVNPVFGGNTKELVTDPLTAWIASLPSGFDLIRDVNLVPELRSRFFTGWNTGISIPLIGAALLALVLYGRGSRRRWPALLLLAGCALYPLVVQIQVLNMEAIPYYFPTISTRYGMSLVPVAVFCLAMVADTRRLRRTTIAVVGIGLVIAGGSAFGYLVI